MNAEIIIISLIVFLSMLSIALGTINWIYLSSTSSKISALEGEIEKKAIEFDAIKKEKSQQHSSTFAENTAPGENPDRSASFTGQENPAIEIVRNVRAEFRQEEAAVQQPMADQGPRTGFVKQQAFSPVAHEALPPGNEIKIALFSQAKKDTDFAAAWKKLSEGLPGTPDAHVKIDFTNVMFLYEKELLYLEKIREVVSSARGRITFVNCHPELRPIISSRRSLARCLVD
jgi:hypothetical protein